MKQLIEHITNMDRGLVFLSAPTKSGKTEILRHFKEGKEKATVMMCDFFYEAVLQYIQEQGNPAFIDVLAAYRYIGIEDLDWFQGRPHTQHSFASVLSRLAENSVVIVTGIELKSRLEHMFSKLQNYVLYEKESETDPWYLQIYNP